MPGVRGGTRVRRRILILLVLAELCRGLSALTNGLLAFPANKDPDRDRLEVIGILLNNLGVSAAPPIAHSPLAAIRPPLAAVAVRSH